MTAFDYKSFLDRYSIPYVTSGPNVAKSNWNIRCPFCGDADPSEHLGINLETGEWGCWRNVDHRGRSALRLVRALLGCSYEQAQTIVGYETQVDVSNFYNIVESLLVSPSIPSEPRTLNFPVEFKKIKRQGHGLKFVRYLEARGFCSEEIEKLADYYGLRCAYEGAFCWRLIFPVYNLNGDLITWTGRSIGDSEIRYKTLSYKEERAEAKGEPTALANIKDYLLWCDKLYLDGGEVLILTEGPFDALKVDWYGKEYGVRATCGFGSNLSEHQVALLGTLLPRFSKAVVLYDELPISMSVARSLPFRNSEVGNSHLPSQVKDPGDLSREQARVLALTCIKDING